MCASCGLSLELKLRHPKINKSRTCAFKGSNLQRDKSLPNILKFPPQGPYGRRSSISCVSIPCTFPLHSHGIHTAIPTKTIEQREVLSRKLSGVMPRGNAAFCVLLLAHLASASGAYIICIWSRHSFKHLKARLRAARKPLTMCLCVIGRPCQQQLLPRVITMPRTLWSSGMHQLEDYEYYGTTIRLLCRP